MSTPPNLAAVKEAHNDKCQVRAPTEQEKKARENFVSEEVYARYMKRKRHKPLDPNDISTSSYRAICGSLGVEVPEGGMWTESRASECEP